MKRTRSMLLVLVILSIVQFACGSSAPTVTPGPAELEEFSAKATSPVSVQLEWGSVPNATAYRIDVRYGDGEFVSVASPAANQTRYDHFIVPGSVNLTYRLSSLSGESQNEIASASVTMPELAPNPLVVEPVPAAPVASGLPDFSALPTIDPQNPDPNAIATLSALGNDLSSLEPQLLPAWVKQDIGPEGGALTLMSADQTVYTLEVPAGAVDEVTTFYLTPIAEITDFPFPAGKLAAVQIHPPIPFGDPLTLTLQTSDQADLNAMPIGFVVSRFNYELSLAPAYPLGDNTYRMNVYWGDTFGLAAITLEEVKMQASRIPSDSAEQLAQQLAALRAFNTDTSAEGEARILAQVMEALLQQAKDLRSQTSRMERARSVAPSIGKHADAALQSQSGASLWDSIDRWERAWSEDQYNPLYDPDNPLHQPLDPTRRANLIVTLVDEIKALLDKQMGCRRREDFYIQALLQILINPGSDFQQHLAENYRSRFGDPKSKKKCTYQLHIMESKIEAEAPDRDGGLIQTVIVHTDPFPLEIVVRGNKLSLTGAAHVFYDKHEAYFTKCPPAVEILPYPSAAIWITDLTPMFDAQGGVSNFALQGVLPDPISTGIEGTLTTETDHAGTCTVVSHSGTGEPLDFWAIAFPGFHNPVFYSDNWEILGGESYVARSDGTDVTVLDITENTKMFLTVNQE